MTAPAPRYKPGDEVIGLDNVARRFNGRSWDIVENETPEPSKVEHAPVETEKKSEKAKKRRSQGTTLDLEDAEPAAEPVNGERLLGEISATVSRYVVVRPQVADTLALWVALTYLADTVDVLPRLLVWSPALSCGKTRLLAVLGGLVRRPVPAISISPAALFRMIEKGSPTLLLDEMDNARLGESPDLRALLNSGHSRTSAWTVRCVGESMDPRKFSTWTPIAFASIGKLPDTVTSRCIQVEMRRRTASEKVERLRPSRVPGEFKPLRSRLARWCQDTTLPEVEESALEFLSSDRDLENWEPLVAIAKAAGGEWPDRVLRAARALSEGLPVGDDSIGVQLLQDMRAVFDGADRISSAEALEALKALEERPWGEWSHGKGLTARGLANLLRPFGVSPDTIRTGDKTPKGYSRDQFEDAWKRYTPPNATDKRNTATEPDNTEPNAVLASATEPARCGSKSTASNSVGAVRCAVADGKHGPYPCQYCGGRRIAWGDGQQICTGCKRITFNGDGLQQWEAPDA